MNKNLGIILTDGRISMLKMSVSMLLSEDGRKMFSAS